MAGFFRTRKRLFVDVSVNNLVPDKQDFRQNAILRGTLGKEALGDSIINESLNGFHARCTAFHNKCRRSPLIGLPEATAIGGFIVDDVVISRIEEELNNPIDELYSTWTDTKDAMTEAQKFFSENGGIEFETNKIVTPVPLGLVAPVYLIEAEWVVENDQIKCLVGDINTDTGEPIGEPEEYFISSTFDTSFYLYAYYRAENKDKVFRYQIGSNIYPELELNIYQDTSVYMPIVSLRKNKESIKPEEPVYKEVRQALRHLGIKLDSLMEDLMSEEDDNDPDVMNDIFLMFGLDIQTKNKESLEYLYRYMDLVYQKGLTTAPAFNNWVESGSKGEPPSTNIEINSGNFKSYLSFLFSNKEIVEEEIGKVGTVESEIILNADFIGPSAGPFKFDSIGVFMRYNTHAFKIKKQISPTHVSEITVVGLTHVHQIFNEKGFVYRTLKDAVEAVEEGTEDRGFYLPINKTILDGMPGMYKSFVCQESLAITIYAADIQRIKWYKSESFLGLLQLAIIAVSIYFMDFSGSGLALLASIAKQVVINLIIGYALTLLIQGLAQVFGIEDIAIIALIATGVALYLGFGVDGLPFATDLLRYTTLTLGAVSTVIQDEVSALMKEMEDLTKTFRERQEEFEEEMELLRGTQIDYLNITGGWPHMNSNETPEMFFGRTLNMNPGRDSIELLSLYVEQKLQLPKKNAYDVYTILSEDEDKIYA